MAFAGGDHSQEIVHAAAGGIDVGQTIIVAPALPDVLDEYGIGEAVERGLFKIRCLAVIAAPLIETDAPLKGGDAAS